MTRINANIDPKNLIDQHLLAEYREMVRIPNAVNRDYSKAIVAIKTAPKTFKLGTGHVVFHYDKLQYLHKRFNAIKIELSNRNIQTNMEDDMFHNLPQDLYNDCDLTYANPVVMERIFERISNMSRVTYYGNKITLEQYIKIINENRKRVRELERNCESTCL